VKEFRLEAGAVVSLKEPKTPKMTIGNIDEESGIATCYYWMGGEVVKTDIKIGALHVIIPNINT
jgi:hypothetical protein